jgi:hypothetical protein
MLNIRTIDGHGSDDPQRRDYKKTGAVSEKPNKQIDSENMNGLGARATITGGDLFMRSAGFYGKARV